MNNKKGFETIYNTVSGKEGLGFWSWFFIILLVLLFVIIAIISFLIDLIDTGTDTVSAGTAGIVTGIFDFISELVLQSLQEGCIVAVMLIVGEGTWFMKLLKFAALTILAAIDILLSFIAIFLPFIDILEPFVEFITDTFESFILGSTVADALS